MFFVTHWFNFREEKSASLSDGMKVGAFATFQKKGLEEEIPIPKAPFSSLLTKKVEEPVLIANNEESFSNKTVVGEDERNGNSPSESRTSDVTMMSTNDDYIMVDLVILLFATRNAC